MLDNIIHFILLPSVIIMLVITTRIAIRARTDIKHLKQAIEASNKARELLKADMYRNTFEPPVPEPDPEPYLDRVTGLYSYKAISNNKRDKYDRPTDVRPDGGN